jgi:hypothetical protein
MRRRHFPPRAGPVMRDGRQARMSLLISARARQTRNPDPDMRRKLAILIRADPVRPIGLRTDHGLVRLGGCSPSGRTVGGGHAPFSVKAEGCPDTHHQGPDPRKPIQRDHPGWRVAPAPDGKGSAEPQQTRAPHVHAGSFGSWSGSWRRCSGSRLWPAAGEGAVQSLFPVRAAIRKGDGDRLQGRHDPGGYDDPPG